MYAIIPQQIPQDRRAEINEKILFAIDSGKDLVPKESIYNCYTGIGGLHNLRQSDFTSYHEYAEAKKEFEMGQFFTPHDICRSMVETLSPTSAEMVLDMCCGMGNFFNHLPNLHNAYGFDIDGKAVAVARYLYPEAHIEKCDIQLYNPEQRFDIIVGNPPFNLKFDYRLSQEFYMDKAYDVLNPAGILMVIVPLSFMQNEFWEKTRVAKINSNFSFIGQTRLEHSAFSTVGVQNFATKIMVFLRRSLHIEMQPYNAEEFVSMDELKKRIAEVRKMKHRLRLQLMRECNHIDKEELEQFEYRLAKYMYELKAHAVLNRHVEKAEALVSKFRNQKPPENATREQIKEWERKKLTTGKVLGIIRRYITSQNVVPRKEVALVKTSYGFKLKQYAPRLLDKVTHKAAGINDLILGRAELPMPENVTEKNMRQIRAASKLIRRKQRQYETQNLQFAEMREDAGLKDENLRLRDHDPEELCFYSKATTDFEFMFPFGWGELWGVADRTDYDLTQHQNTSGKDLTYFDQEKNEHYIPYVIEPSLGVERSFLAFLCDAYDEEVLGQDKNGNDDIRTVLRLHPALAPYKAAVLPLSKKLADKGREIQQELSKYFMVDYDDAGSIGKRYRREDEIGTPLCITVDFETVGDENTPADHCVTIRDRDTMEQVRIPISELRSYIEKKLEF